MNDDLILELKNINKSFRGLKAISDVSLSLHPGEIVGLIGPNGAGKTTLFNVISGFQMPDSGSVTFKVHSIVGLKPHKICKLGLTRTFQIVKPFNQLTILQNVAVGCFNWASDFEAAEAEAWKTLEFVGLEKKALDEAKSTTIPDRKRLELARALASKPELILLDEVMAGLNPTEQTKIIDLVRQIRDSGVSVFIIEHSMRVIMGLCDRICVIHHGQVIAVGTPSQVCADKNVINSYLGEGSAFVKT
jgi:ABC-type branched-subunit amino acid transport system ATPase component